MNHYHHEGWSNTTVITGGASGADAIAAKWTKKYLGQEPEIYKADWKTHGKAAGPIRNQQMLDEGKPDIVIAFWDGKSPGTKDMITRAIQAGLNVYIVARKD